jgi:cytochrome P450
METEAAALAGRFDALMTTGVGIADPFPLYEDLNAVGPIHDFGGALVVTGHAAIREVIRGDGQMFVNALGQRGEQASRARAELSGPALEAFDSMARFSALIMPERSREDHARLRSIVHRSFTPRQIANLAADIDRYVDELLSEVADMVNPDLARITNGLPLMVTSDLLGISHDELDRLQAAVATFVAPGSGAVAATPAALLAAHQAIEELLAFGAQLAERHRDSDVSAGLVGSLVQAERDGRLSREEFVAMLVFLVISSQETTTNLLAIGTIALLQEPSQWAALCADPDGTAVTATEELLRFVAPVQFVSRTAIADGEVAGRPFRAGQQLLLLLAAANRDPAVFAEPQRLDVGRPDAGEHLSLGFGIHFCLGASLLRLESRVYLRELARRFPTLRLATEELEWLGHVQLRRPSRVPVDLGERVAGGAKSVAPNNRLA